jgi:hypothetical protein
MPRCKPHRGGAAILAGVYLGAFAAERSPKLEPSID